MSLIAAVSAGHVPLAEHVFPGATQDTKFHALEMAIRYHHHEMIEKLIKLGTQINRHPSGKQPILTYAILCGDMKTVHLLVEHGYYLDASDKYGWTALMEAAEEDNLEVVQYLVQSGADITLQTFDGLTAEECTNDPKIAEYLHNMYLEQKHIQYRIQITACIRQLQKTGPTHILSQIPEHLFRLVVCFI